MRGFEHRVEGRRVAPSLVYVSAQRPPNRTDESSPYPALPQALTACTFPCRCPVTPEWLHKVYHLRPSRPAGRAYLWPFALCVAFPRSLGGRDSTDYYGQSAPPWPDTAQASHLRREGSGWFPGSYLVTGMGSGWFPNTFPLTGGLRAGSSQSQALGPTYRSLRVRRQPLLPAYSPPGIIGRVCQSCVDHVSPSPLTG
jgi:hypothetical protein